MFFMTGSFLRIPNHLLEPARFAGKDCRAKTLLGLGGTLTGTADGQIQRAPKFRCYTKFFEKPTDKEPCFI